MKLFTFKLASMLLVMSSYCLAEASKVGTVILTKRGIQSSSVVAKIEMLTTAGEIIRSQIKRSDRLGASACFIAELKKYSQLEYSLAVQDQIIKEMCSSEQEMVFSHYCETDAGHVDIAEYPVIAKVKPQFIQINLTDGKTIPIGCN